MKQMLDVLYLEKTGHVLHAVARAGVGEGPPAAALAGTQVLYPARKGAKDIVDALVAASELELARVSVPVTETAARVLFQRELHEVKDGALVAGLAPPQVSLSGGRVSVTISAVTAATPYVVIGVPTDGNEPVVYDGEIPPMSSAAYQLTHSFPASDVAHVVVFAKGFSPEAD